MARYRLHHSLGRRAVVRHLHRWTKRHFSDQCRCRHQKLSDSKLLALLLARFVFKHPHPSVWRSLLREGRHGLPSYTQAYTRGLRLLEKLEEIVTPSVLCKEVIIDSMPLPVCRPKRGKRCAFPGATWGYGTQGQVYGYKLHAWRRAAPSRWVSPTGTIVQYVLRPANLHDTTVGYELNRRWPEFGGPKIIGDKRPSVLMGAVLDKRGYCSLGFVFPPKTNTRYDTGWREDRHPKLRKRIETVFSQLVEAQIRSVQTKTLASLRLRVVLATLAHNLAQP